MSFIFFGIETTSAPATTLPSATSPEYEEICDENLEHVVNVYKATYDGRLLGIYHQFFYFSDCIHQGKLKLNVTDYKT